MAPNNHNFLKNLLSLYILFKMFGGGRNPLYPPLIRGLWAESLHAVGGPNQHRWQELMCLVLEANMFTIC